LPSPLSATLFSDLLGLASPVQRGIGGACPVTPVECFYDQ
jgi:hypothetical protein